MRYLSIDLETTGLNPDNCQILEFAAVLEDTSKSLAVEDLPNFTCLVKHELYTGEAYAMAMNAKIIAMLAGREKPDLPIYEAIELAGEFGVWLLKQDLSGEIVVAGKNYATFDKLFLEKLIGWREGIKTFRRVLDPCTLYMDVRRDTMPPGFSDCLRRAGLDSTVKHRALGDAQDVIRLLRYKYATGSY